MSRRRMQVYYSGHVQGVGFRYSIKALAPGFEVAGFVRNLADGRVELVLEGTEDELRAMLTAIRNSELRGLIQDERVSWSEALGQFRGFEIAR